MLNPPPARSQTGFSLAELLIVIVIVGVLAAIGLPAYQDYARKSKRADAAQSLLRMAQLQERFYTDNNTYANAASTLGYGNDTPLSNESYWQLSVTAGSATGYALQAVPTGGHQDPDCATITLNSAGVKGSTPTDTCWKGK